jgi:hypothetical protein
VRWLTVPAKWGTNFRQSCRVVAKAASGGAAQSSHFLLDFASPHVLTVKQECVIARTQCEITGSTFYQTPGVGQQLEQGVLVCDNKTLTTKVIVNDVYGLEGDIPDDCSGNTKVGGLVLAALRGVELGVDCSTAAARVVRLQGRAQCALLLH